MKVKFVRRREFVSAGPAGPAVRVFEVGDVVELPELHARMEVMQGAAVREGEWPVAEVVDVPLNAPVIPNEGDEQPSGEWDDSDVVEDEQPDGEQVDGEQVEVAEPKRRARRRT